MLDIKPPERLIVAADYRPAYRDVGNAIARRAAKAKVIELAQQLRDTGVVLKINSILRAWGYDLIDEIHNYGLKVFADLKLCDIDNTLSHDGDFLRESSPEILTVMCTSGVKAMQALKKELPRTEILGVTVLTSMEKSEVDTIYTCSTGEAVVRLAGLAAKAGLGGFVSSPVEVESLCANFGFAFSAVTPAIRPTWSLVPGDDQNPERIMTPGKAIKAGADRIVVGRPITQAAYPLEAVKRTIAEIEEALV